MENNAKCTLIDALRKVDILSNGIAWQRERSVQGPLKFSPNREAA
jgi:hypothetical protein